MKTYDKMSRTNSRRRGYLGTPASFRNSLKKRLKRSMMSCTFTFVPQIMVRCSGPPSLVGGCSASVDPWEVSNDLYAR